MRYYFHRCDGKEWYKLIKFLKSRGTTFLEVNSEDLYNPLKVDNPFCAYYYRTTSSCKLIYYEVDEFSMFKKKLSEINFSENDIDPVKCVLEFRKIASKYNENIDYEPNKVYTNGVYTYFYKPYEGYSTALDMNSAYLFALSQKLADWESCREITPKEVFSKEYDFYSFENELHCEMYYKEDMEKMKAAMLWSGTKIYGYKSKHYYTETIKELYRLRKIDKERYKNVANIAVGCMHKHSGERNNTTIAASLYAWFAWYIDDKVVKFEEKGYNVIMITTDSIKIAGKYNPNDNLVTLGDGLGEFKVEFEGEAKYYSQGHYVDNRVKWKGMPQYMVDGHKRCLFIDNIEEEREIYVNYAKTTSKSKNSKKKENRSKRT